LKRLDHDPTDQSDEAEFHSTSQPDRYLLDPRAVIKPGPPVVRLLSPGARLHSACPGFNETSEHVGTDDMFESRNLRKVGRRIRSDYLLPHFLKL
jgi:hypothetical protein